MNNLQTAINKINLDESLRETVRERVSSSIKKKPVLRYAILIPAVSALLIVFALLPVLMRPAGKGMNEDPSAVDNSELYGGSFFTSDGIARPFLKYKGQYYTMGNTYINDKYLERYIGEKLGTSVDYMYPPAGAEIVSSEMDVDVYTVKGDDPERVLMSVLRKDGNTYIKFWVAVQTEE